MEKNFYEGLTTDNIIKTIVSKERIEIKDEQWVVNTGNISGIGKVSKYEKS